MRLQIAAASFAFILILAPSALSAAALADAKTYIYPFGVDDPANDQNAPLGAPGSQNPENDITKFEVTDDNESLIFRVTMATLDFGAPEGTVVVTVKIVGNKSSDLWEATAFYANGGTMLTFGQDLRPGGQEDDDEPLPGLRVELDVPAKTLYFFSDFEDNDLKFNDTIKFQGHTNNDAAVASGRGTPTGLSFAQLDTVTMPGSGKYPLLRGAFPPAPKNNTTQTPEPTDVPSISLVTATLGFVVVALVEAGRRRK